MKLLSLSEYNQLKDGATVIEEDACGEKVITLKDGSYIKLFRNKRLISSALFFPYAKRFVKNAHTLNELGIPCVQVIDMFKISKPPRCIVRYLPLNGQTVREAAAAANSGSIEPTLIKRIAEFISTLHNKGIYFRSLHLGNILLQDSNQLGLIDVADLKFYRKPLSINKRIRNFNHLIRYKDDVSLLFAQSPINFIDAYLKASQSYISNKNQQTISNALNTLVRC
ncbi:hypothetical protein [Zooshikella ganghwensis]|uniref:hypothetical protein n=1 Tax=Zooshikella ganghwensis TaxID=202772 RepID=UPI0004221D08|nr:hypothetical protein [Zooshikella ganghwensis]